jgi:hypothetical protein
MQLKALPEFPSTHAAAQSSLSAPRATIFSAASGNGLCSVFASSHGARIQTSRSSSVGLPASPSDGSARPPRSAMSSENHRPDAVPAPAWNCFVAALLAMTKRLADREKGVDGRVKPGHDEPWQTPLISHLTRRANHLRDLSTPLSSPFCKNILIFRRPKSLYIRSRPAPQRGVAQRHETRSGMRWTRAARLTGDAASRTAKACGPDAPTLASSRRKAIFAGEGGKKARSPGRARYKP